MIASSPPEGVCTIDVVGASTKVFGMEPEKPGHMCKMEVKCGYVMKRRPDMTHRIGMSLEDWGIRSVRWGWMARESWVWSKISSLRLVVQAEVGYVGMWIPNDMLKPKQGDGTSATKQATSTDRKKCQSKGATRANPRPEAGTNTSQDHSTVTVACTT